MTRFTINAKSAIIITFFLLLLAPSRGSTTITLQTANDLFAAGNAFYQGQQFQEAREAYFQLLRAGFDTAPVLYNLGTAEARLGSSTRATAYLTRAKNLRPRDKNIRANMAFVKPPPTTPDGNPVNAESVWSRTYGFFTAREWLVFIWSGLCLACCGGALLLLSRPGRFHTFGRVFVLVGGSLLLLVSVPAATQYYQTQIVKKAIVVTSSELLSGPADRFTRVTNLAEGQVVRSLDRSTAGYKHIELDNGLHGYVKQDALLKL